MSTDRILIVEDTRTQAKTLQHLLSPGGFEMQIVREPLLALAEARAFGATAVLSDITMPELDGYELCQQFKSDPLMQTVPFILLSGFSDTRELKRIISCGADGFIFKSFDPKFFLPRFQAILAAARKPITDKETTRLTLDSGAEIDVPASRLFNMLMATFETAMFHQMAKSGSATVA